MNSNEKVLPEAASLSDIYIYPLIRTSTQTNENYVLDYGYVCTAYPCEAGCIEHLANSLYRPKGWQVSRHACGNFIEFADLSRYLSCVGQRGRRLKDIHSYMEVNFFYSGKEGTNDGLIPVKDRVRLDGE